MLLLLLRMMMTGKKWCYYVHPSHSYLQVSLSLSLCVCLSVSLSVANCHAQAASVATCESRRDSRSAYVPVLTDIRLMLSSSTSVHSLVKYLWRRRGWTDRLTVHTGMDAMCRFFGPNHTQPTASTKRVSRICISVVQFSSYTTSRF